MAQSFNWKWSFKDYPDPSDLKVFGTFICGGGSTMGYKLAGFQHLGGVEIDPKMARVYQANHKPKHLFVEDIRAFNQRKDLPPELFDLDILDGSPPCSSFSVSGAREKGWDKKKVFREGQASQKLDDLFFHFIDLANRLRPKVVIAENVPGLVKGNAKAYVRHIADAFKAAGYDVQLFLLNAASMGVPQKRERTFFIARRKDFNVPPLKLAFNHPPIFFRDVMQSSSDNMLSPDSAMYPYWHKSKPGEKFDKYHPTGSFFNNHKLPIYDVARTICSSSPIYHPTEIRGPINIEYQGMQTFPQDYDFLDFKAQYICGMSVPPVMMAQVASEIKKQWFNNGRT